MSLDKLLGYKDFVENDGINMARDVIPDGVRARLEEHKEDLFREQHNHVRQLEFAARAIQYGVEFLIVFDASKDARQIRNLIRHLSGHVEVLRTLTYRSWLNRNGFGKYQHAELTEMKKVTRFAYKIYTECDDLCEKFMENTIAEFVVFCEQNGINITTKKDDEGEYQENIFDEIEELAKQYNDAIFSKRLRELNYLHDIVESLSVAEEWLAWQSRATGVNDVPDTWDQLYVRDEVIAELEGREVQVVADPLKADGELMLDNKQAADFLGVTEKYMKQMRCTKTGPTYIKVKSQNSFRESILYDRNDIIAWLKEKKDTLDRVRARKAPAARYIALQEKG